MTEIEQCRACVAMLDKMSEEIGSCLTAASFALHRLDGDDTVEAREHVDKALKIFAKCKTELQRIKAIRGTENGIAIDDSIGENDPDPV